MPKPSPLLAGPEAWDAVNAAHRNALGNSFLHTTIALQKEGPKPGDFLPSILEAQSRKTTYAIIEHLRLCGFPGPATSVLAEFSSSPPNPLLIPLDAISPHGGCKAYSELVALAKPLSTILKENPLHAQP